MNHLNLHIIGKVQGVWYRGSAQQQARALGLQGFVCNLSDGSVYAEAEGTAEQLQAFTDWCWEGPELARVEKVEVKEGEMQHFSGFEVRR